MHTSCCATNNGPALEPGPCDCGHEAMMRAWQEYVGQFREAPAGHILDLTRTAFEAGWRTQAEQIEQLQAHSAARAQDIITLGQEVGRLQSENDRLQSEIEKLRHQQLLTGQQANVNTPINLLGGSLRGA